jgi:hypothetical protein
VIVLGGLLALWGALVLWFARPLHEGWRDMLRSMRGAGVRNDLPGTAFMASERGYLWMRRAGTAALLVGLAVSAVGAVVRLVESM